MAVLDRPRSRYTYAEYVALEETSSTKHEYFDGEIYAMAGGSDIHAALAANTIAALVVASKGSGCQVYTSDLRIYVESIGLATFPDVSVVRGDIVQHAPSPQVTALNPAILVEVTSASTESYDTGFKLTVYRMIPSLREVIIVSHRERCITIHRRTETDGWTRHVAMTGDRIAVETLRGDLVVDDLYDGTSIR